MYVLVHILGSLKHFDITSGLQKAVINQLASLKVVKEEHNGEKIIGNQILAGFSQIYQNLSFAKLLVLVLGDVCG